MQPLSHLSAIADRYDALILDLWGVIHDGSQLYPGVHDALTQLRQAGKKIVMLSNAPRRARKVEAVLNHLGVETALYDGVVSSGEVGYRWFASPSPLEGEGRVGGMVQHNRWSNALQQPPLPNPPPQGGRGLNKHYYYIGPSKDADVLDGLDYKRVDDLKDAGFLLNVGFGSEEQSAADWMPLLRAARGLKLPMLCLNPDLEVVKITGERYPCAGVIAYAYQAMGGAVTWFGKPYGGVYDYCMGMLQGIGKNRILAVGDSLETDMKGAEDFGIDSLLITGGILKSQSPEAIAARCAQLNLSPTYIMPRLAW